MMGEVTKELKRIGILFCIDGIPAFNYKVTGFSAFVCGDGVRILTLICFYFRDYR